jgi:hypothetical protein
MVGQPAIGRPRHIIGFHLRLQAGQEAEERHSAIRADCHAANALYVLYDDWATLSQKPRSEILKLPTSKFDRIIHTEGWTNRFAKLMQHELQLRGVRIRIGRNQRRRQH